MKDDHLDSKSGWDHSKRKGKEKATESSFRVETMGTPWGDKVHGGGSCDGSCQPGPACSLFPRRPDGKVILPDPRDISRQGEWDLTTDTNLADVGIQKKSRQSRKLSRKVAPSETCCRLEAALLSRHWT